MSFKYAAVSTMTESGDSDVFCIDFREPKDVVAAIKDMMDEEFPYVSEFKVHCSWGMEIEMEILKRLKIARNNAREETE